MPTSPNHQIRQIARAERLRTLRNWCAGIGIVALALALMTTRNPVGNPKSWASAFNALGASGAFIQYAGWLAGSGILFLLVAAIVALYLGVSE